MSSFWAPALLALYYSVLVVLSFFGLHRLMLVAIYLRTGGRRPAPPPPAMPADPQAWPVVTVQLPLYNEMYVAERLIDAVCRLDYPAGRLEIQLLDPEYSVGLAHERKVHLGEAAVGGLGAQYSSGLPL